MVSAAIAEEASARAWRSYRSTTHFDSLDGLRCLSILAVIWHHGPGSSMHGLGGRGFMGVPLFFAISGFLITTLLLRERERNGAISLKKFYLRRSLRIFPLYYGVLITYVVLVPLAARGPDQARTFFGHLPYFATYTSNWFVGTEGTFAFAWSLAAEEQFYSTWPSILSRLSLGRAAAAVGALLVAIFTAIVLHALGIGAHTIGFVILSNVPMAICWGCLAAIALHCRRSFQFLWKTLGRPWSPVVLLAATLAILAALHNSDLPVHFLFAVLVAACVVREDHRLAAVLRQRWIAYLGVISYGMYLLHGLVFDGLGIVGNRLSIPGLAHGYGGFVLALGLTICPASLSFRYYEAPFLRLKTRFEV